MNRFSLRARLIVVGVLLAIAPQAITLAIVWREITGEARQASVELAETNLKHIAEQAYSMTNAGGDMLAKMVDKDLAAARAALERGGRIQAGETNVEWLAVNQFSKETSAVELPQLLVGEEWLGQVRDPAVMVPVVDTLPVSTGATSTIFQRMNETNRLNFQP